MGMFGKAVPPPQVEHILEQGEQVVGTMGSTWISYDISTNLNYDDLVVTTRGLRVRKRQKWSIYPFSEMVNLSFGSHAITFLYKSHQYIAGQGRAAMLTDLIHQAQTMGQQASETAYHTTRDEGESASRQENIRRVLPDGRFKEVGSGVDDFRRQQLRLSQFADTLVALELGDAVGKPFGDGWGLRSAMDAMRTIFQSRDYMRSAAGMVAGHLVLGFGTDELFTFDDLREVMGASPDACRRNGVPPTEASAIEASWGGACALIAEFGGYGGGGPTWELWQARDDVAAEFLCWHMVATLRLSRIGKLPDIHKTLGC